MKISMIPNKIVKLIHASKGDTSLRKWAFEPYDNNGAINVSNIKDQLVYKTENGGTEQLLPVNTSTPTTSYFDGTINYGTDTDAEFTYKQSSYTGQARIKSIKGNTLVWNQLIGELDATTTWNDIAITNNGNGSLTLSGTYSGSSIGNMYITTGNVSVKANHVYLLDTSCSTLADQTVRIGNSSSFGVLKGGYEFHKPAVDLSGRLDFRVAVGRTYNDTIFPNMFDFTDMFGETIADEILAMETAHTGDGVAYFRSLFPLNYYAYNSGSLLNFNGTGIKTTGKNFVTNYLSDSTTANISWTQTDGVVTFSGKANGTTRTPALTSSISLKKGSYILSGCTGGSATTYALRIQGYINGTWGGIGASDNYDGDTAFTLDEDTDVRLQGRFDKTQTTEYNVTFYPMIRVSGSDSTFEPYTTSTTSLPLSTYFPTGMKDVYSSSGTIVYDELSDKAITRVGGITYDGSSDEEWSTRTTSGGYVLYETVLTGAKNVGTQQRSVIKNNQFEWSTNVSADKTIRMVNITLTIRYDTITSLADWKTFLSNNPLQVNFELATYTETDIQNASLVCKNIEVPCYLSNGNLVCDATEELTNESGFFDAKLKLKDSSSVAYSSKFKLHVEDL